jgi:hypothetical protein
MKRLSLFFAAALVFAALPDAAHAQSRTDGGWWEWAAQSDRANGSARSNPERRNDRYERRDDRRDDRYDNRYERRDDRRNDKGPKFCQNGQGHPTKGMRWCYDKGFASPRYDRRDNRRDDRRRAPQWERRTIGDIIFGTPRRDQDRRRATMDQRVLGEILGRSAVRDLERAASGAIVGRWVRPSRNVRVLQLRDSRGPLAEMTDYDADGRVDLVLVNSLR